MLSCLSQCHPRNHNSRSAKQYQYQCGFSQSPRAKRLISQPLSQQNNCFLLCLFIDNDSKQKSTSKVRDDGRHSALDVFWVPSANGAFNQNHALH